ncbi:hypothetical protein [Microseira sp. BLCC-F43]|jgi:hypothetical protein|uniref:hypothetical protein n=1 Tax=Microseira sp. BLCC-F43 TaxID=3153602 RepID=UPI0035B9C842
MSKGQIYCFRASCEGSNKFNNGNVPGWLCLGVNWQGYMLWTVPEVVDVARLLGALEFEEDTPSEWISHLESLGFKDITPVCCEEMFESRGYSF